MQASPLPPKRTDGIPLLHDFVNFRQNALDFWIETGEIAPVVRVQFGPRQFWVVTDADWFEHIFKTKARQYPRESRLIDPKQMDGAFTVFTAPTYEDWLWRRRLLQPAFHRKQIANFAEAMVEETQQLVAQWEATIDLKSAMKTLTMRIIGRTMFSADLRETDLLQQCFETVSEHSFRTLAAIVPTPLWLPTPHNQAFKSAEKTRQTILRNIIEQRYASGEPEGDLLDMLIAARLEDGDHQFTPDDLLREMLSVIFAGHETTAMTLLWVFYRLSQHPDIEATVRDEIGRVLGDRPATLADLDQMPYTEQLIEETMRVHPAVYLTIREAAEDDHFGGYHIPAGTKFALNIRGVHLSPRYWDAPAQFDPGRFAAPTAHHKFAFQPFISGPRKCIGDTFAMMEMRLIIPTILQQYRLTLHGENRPKPVARLVMETEDTVLMDVQRHGVKFCN